MPDCELISACDQIQLFGRPDDVEAWCIEHPNPTRDEVIAFARGICDDLAKNPRPLA